MFKVLFFLLLLFSLFAFGAPNVDLRNEFLTQYYAGDYEKAHLLLNQAISDIVQRQIWESRIHLQENISSCNAAAERNGSIDSFAYLSIGKFEEAQKHYSEDWISSWAKATYANWNADVQAARQHIQHALTLRPDYPDLHFFAGDVAETPAKTIEFFEQFMKMESADPVKRNIADFSIQLLKKTAGIQLNLVRWEPGVQEIKTDYESTGVVIRGTVNSKEKMKLVLDTGAGNGLVFEKRDWTPQVVNDVVLLGLGKKQITHSKRIVLDHFETGKFTIENPLATQNDSMPFSDMDGLIGSAVFGTHRILLPVKSGKNVILLPYDTDPDQYFASNGMKWKKKLTVPFYVVNKLMILKGRIKKSPQELDIMLDTGADTSLVSIAAAKKYASINYPLSLQMRSETKVSGVGGKADNLLIAENVEVGIGEFSKNFNNLLAINFAESSEALGLEIDALLGRDFLYGFTLLIDYRNRLVTFLKS